MKDFISYLKNLFCYKSKTLDYNFSLPKISSNSSGQEQNIKSSDNNISTSLEENLNKIKLCYHTIINSDIILRKFQLNLNGNSYAALILCIDGMVNVDLVNNFLIRPLMETKNQSNIKYFYKNGIQIAKHKKINLVDFIYNCLIPQNSIKEISSLNDLIAFVNSGNCALIVDTLNIAFSIDVKGFKAREISSPSNEIVVRGSQEAFVENLRTNTSILRRLVNSENLIIESSTVGKISKTNVAICYLHNIANSALINEVKHRINNLDIDYIISSRAIRTINRG